MKKIFTGAQQFLSNNCLITGGHYRIFYKNKSLIENLNEGTINSFKLAVSLYKIAKYRKLVIDIGILINDMGASCDDNECDIKNLGFERESYRLPSQYLEILEQESIFREEIKIFWEKHIRNRGKKEFLKKLKKNNSNIFSEAEGFFISDSCGFGKIILTRKRGNDKYGVPACPLIMAGLNLEQNKTYKSSINFYYIGNDNQINIPNYFVIEKGKRVSEIFGATISVNNIYFNELL
jgi:hypothetical protein